MCLPFLSSTFFDKLLVFAAEFCYPMGGIVSFSMVRGAADRT